MVVELVDTIMGGPNVALLVAELARVPMSPLWPVSLAAGSLPPLN